MHWRSNRVAVQGALADLEAKARGVYEKGKGNYDIRRRKEFS